MHTRPIRPPLVIPLELHGAHVAVGARSRPLIIPEQTPTNYRFSFSHVILTRACLPALMITIACIGAACGGGGVEGETDDTGGDVKPGYFPDYVVDCLPESPKESLVCIPRPDWDCAVRGHYFRESICANILGGTPAGYDEKPEIVRFDPDGAWPEEPTSDIYCDNPPKGVAQTRAHGHRVVSV